MTKSELLPANCGAQYISPNGTRTCGFIENMAYSGTPGTPVCDHFGDEGSCNLNPDIRVAQQNIISTTLFQA